MTPAMLLRSRSAAPTNRVRGLAAVPATILAVLLAAALMDGADYILVTPVAANAVLLVSFGVTLRRRSMPMIERFARLQEATLSDQQRAWCRLWTKIWCAFFVTNGATAALLAACLALTAAAGRAPVRASSRYGGPSGRVALRSPGCVCHLSRSTTPL